MLMQSSKLMKAKLLWVQAHFNALFPTAVSVHLFRVNQQSEMLECYLGWQTEVIGSKWEKHIYISQLLTRRASHLQDMA